VDFGGNIMNVIGGIILLMIFSAIMWFNQKMKELRKLPGGAHE